MAGRSPEAGSHASPGQPRRTLHAKLLPHNPRAPRALFTEREVATRLLAPGTFNAGRRRKRASPSQPGGAARRAQAAGPGRRAGRTAPGAPRAGRATPRSSAEPGAATAGRGGGEPPTGTSNRAPPAGPLAGEAGGAPGSPSGSPRRGAPPPLPPRGLGPSERPVPTRLTLCLRLHGAGASAVHRRRRPAALPALPAGPGCRCRRHRRCPPPRRGRRAGRAAPPAGQALAALTWGRPGPLASAAGPALLRDGRWDPRGNDRSADWGGPRRRALRGQRPARAAALSPSGRRASPCRLPGAGQGPAVRRLRAPLGKVASAAVASRSTVPAREV